MQPRQFEQRGKGAGIEWLRAHVSYTGAGCLIWPMSKRKTGYGLVGFERKVYSAHRMMCRLAHGEPPTPDHEAAHSCGNGHGGCVHPRHLAWKTASENHLDRRNHGTAVTSRFGSRGKLTREQKAEIIALKGQHTQADLAATYGVAFQTISRLHREDPNRVYVHRAFHSDDDRKLIDLRAQGMPVSRIAKEMGRTLGSVTARLHRLRAAGRLRKAA